jgi:type I restriction enzyme, S subunit
MMPEGWHRSTLGEIARITSGGTPDRSEPSYWGGSVPWVTTGEIQFNTITDTVEKITEAGLKNSSAKLFPPGTLLMAMYGQGKTRGQVAKLAIEASTNQNSAAILLNEGHDPDFYFQFLSWKYDEIRDFGHSGGVSHLNAGLLKLIGVPVAPIDEQRKVARILGSWDAAIAKAQRLLCVTHRRNRSFMSSLLSGRRRLATKVRAWSYRDFDEVFERVARKNAVGNENVLTISGEHGLISQREFFNKSVASADLSGYTLLHRGEFAYNKSYSAGYPMGAIKPLMNYDAGVVSSLYLCFRLRPGVDASFDFFRHYFEIGLLNEGIGGIAQEGARNHGLLNVGIGDFFKLRLHVPDADEQRAIATAINTAEAEEQLQLQRLSALRAEKLALMQQLLTGKRRVHLPATEGTP